MSSPVGSFRPGNMVGTTGPTPQAAPAGQQAAPGTPAGLRAPLALTLPAPPRHDSAAGASATSSATTAERADSTREAAGRPARGGTTPSRADAAQRKLDAAAEKHGQAKQAGVEVAKSSFWKKCIGVATATAGVAIAAALTAMSFGAAAPLLGLACATLVVAGGDAVCAYRNLKNAQAEADHQPLPFDRLPMGNSCVANLMHGVLTGCGVSDSTARTASTVVSIGISAGLAIASVAVGAGLADVPMAFKAASAVVSGVNTAMALYSTAAAQMTDDMDRDFVRATGDEVRAEVQRLRPAGGGGELDESGRRAADEILDEIAGDKAQLMLEKSLADGGRNRDMVRGGLGMAGTIAKGTGLTDMAHAAFSAIRG